MDEPNILDMVVFLDELCSTEALMSLIMERLSISEVGEVHVSSSH